MVSFRHLGPAGAGDGRTPRITAGESDTAAAPLVDSAVQKNACPIVDQGPDCPLCESAHLTGRHCKFLCPNCGYVESCEDNFVPNQDSPLF